ncbi:MAG TPA: FmdB family zinc ribbon protein, partial [Candidatus Sulfotelmatobacter sp.]|nr:FmdB family zinc ribbon protein [Candidatus Sulfotelmatobacter sp.]
MKNPANRIARSNQATPGVEGYVYDGADESQMAFWTCTQTATSAEHVHEFEEYMLAVQGCYTLLIAGKRIPINAGEVPVYDYISNDCKKSFETVLTLAEHDKERISCPHCGSKNVEQEA